MELNAEINRVFGQEMAKVFAASIDEETLKQKAEQVWYQFNNSSTRYVNDASSYIIGAFKDSLIDEIKEITGTDEFKKRMKEMAEPMVKEIIAETRRKTIECVSDQMSQLYAGSHGGLASMVENVVYQMMQR